MDFRSFYPDVYIKAGDGITITTQALLTTALADYTNLEASESVEIGESKGKDIQFTTGRKFQLSKINDGKISFLECTSANYDYLRLTFNKKVCSIILNEIYGSGAGLAVQIKNIIPSITRGVKSGDLMRIDISFKIESAIDQITITETTGA